jgi:hypothetical protein
MAQDHPDCLVGWAKIQKETKWTIYWIKNNAFNVSEKRTVTSNNQYANICHQIGCIPIKYHSS